MWYEIYRDAKTPFESDGVCVTATYGLNQDGSLSVYNHMLNKVDNSIDDIKGRATCEGSEGQCEVKFNFFATGDYRVISTDYDTYSLVYSCTNYLYFKNEYVWILSKQT